MCPKNCSLLLLESSAKYRRQQYLLRCPKCNESIFDQQTKSQSVKLNLLFFCLIYLNNLVFISFYLVCISFYLILFPTMGAWEYKTINAECVCKAWIIQNLNCYKSTNIKFLFLKHSQALSHMLFNYIIQKLDASCTIFHSLITSSLFLSICQPWYRNLLIHGIEKGQQLVW